MSYSQIGQQGADFDESRNGDPKSQYQSSPSPEPAPNGSKLADTKHRRNYQACEQCRQRKVKCDLGDVDNPHDPPCKKCAREKKQCTFKAQRRKSPVMEPADRPPTKRPRTYSSNSGSKDMPPTTYSPHSSTGFAPHGSPFSANAFQPVSPTMNLPVQQITSNPLSPTPRSFPPHFQTANVSMQTGKNNLAFGMNQAASSAAPITSRDNEHWSAPKAGSFADQFNNTTGSFETLVKAASAAEGGNMYNPKNRSRALPGSQSEQNATNMTPRESEARKAAMEAWNQFRLVRQGWFTAAEAMEYVEYFYTHLAPMVPVVTQDFRSPENHRILLTEEPVLAVAILSIASRNMPLHSDSKVGRNFYIHENLWTSLRGTIQRLLWGQEQFGGGYCGAGVPPTRDPSTGQITWKGSLRTLGTIEALLLLTEWQPRALHFPPGNDENNLMNGDASLFNHNDAGADDDRSANVPFSYWLEPAWRSDRMSWMLLGLAQALAFELGVFDTSHPNCRDGHTPDCIRKRRLRRMVILYVSQISGRIGIQPSLSPAQDVDVNMPPGKEEAVDRMHTLWFDIAYIMFDANANIFANRSFTNDLIQSGEYKRRIADFSPRLQDWQKRFALSEKLLDEPMRYILKMEYEYARLYINSLGLQRVLERWVQIAPQDQSSTSNTMKFLVPIVNENKHYINEVSDAATQIQRAVVDGLARIGSLRDAPVRTFLRCLSGMMFTLKVRILAF